jgi:hypothetical protein
MAEASLTISELVRGVALCAILLKVPTNSVAKPAIEKATLPLGVRHEVGGQAA